MPDPNVCNACVSADSVPPLTRLPSCHRREKWEDITVACWQKYPNPQSPHVLSVDTLRREVDPATQCLHTTRLMQKDNKKPVWMNPWLPDTITFIVEESVLDPTVRTPGAPHSFDEHIVLSVRV